MNIYRKYLAPTTFNDLFESEGGHVSEIVVVNIGAMYTVVKIQTLVTVILSLIILYV